MSTVAAELRIKTDVMSRALRNTDTVIEPGDKVRVFRETDKKYIGPYKS